MERNQTLLTIPETPIGDLTMYIPSCRLLSPSYQTPPLWQIFVHTTPAYKYNPFETIPTLLEWCLTQSYISLLNHCLLSYWGTMFSVTGFTGFTGFWGVCNSPSSGSLSSSD
ncbi:hypothetical protein M9H77_14265 [Catharanthus roseus]|uniref:Uncharacterized protein n=1 Tax=Catharanthus roseus TaxID=4058 RepID=A0ACC0BMT6_CATRO|nr:hypothetical protein M9H77_14265 [Catharanthus roseus]